MLINFTVADLARKLEITYETVTGVLNRWVTTKVDSDKWERIKVLGADEIALKGGHRDYVVLVTVPLIPKGFESSPGSPQKRDYRPLLRLSSSSTDQR